jgi:hypothetical protein
MSVDTCGCCMAPYDTRESGSDGARAMQMGGIGHVGGCREAPYNTREGGSDGASAMQVGGIGHVGGCCEAPYDTRGSSSDIARALQGCRALVPPLLFRTESDPHVSKPSFRVESVQVCLRDLNRPSSLSKATFVSGQAKSGPNRLGFGGP